MHNALVAQLVKLSGNASPFEQAGGDRNELVYTDDFTDGWFFRDHSITESGILAPDGSYTAQKLTEAATSGVRWFNQNGSKLGDGTRTFTIYAKEIEGSAKRYLQINAHDAASDKFQNFDVGAGTTSTERDQYSDSYKITPARFGFYRCEVTVTLAPGDDYTFGGKLTADINSYKTTTYQGDGTSGLIIWAPQQEDPANNPTFDLGGENLGTEPTVGRPMIVEDFLNIGTVAIGIGTNSVQDNQAIYQLLIKVEQGTGRKAAQELASFLLIHFARGMRFTDSYLTTEIMQAEVGNAFTEKGWYNLPIEIRARALV